MDDVFVGKSRRKRAIFPLTQLCLRLCQRRKTVRRAKYNTKFVDLTTLNLSGEDKAESKLFRLYANRSLTTADLTINPKDVDGPVTRTIAAIKPYNGLAKYGNLGIVEIIAAKK